MKLFLFLTVSFFSIISFAQTDSLSKTRWIAGFGFPELIHGGVRFDLFKHSQLGVSLGFLPNFDELVAAASIEHRLYFTKINSGKLNWFTRQSFTYVSDRENGGLLAFTVGTDLKMKSGNKGWTFDVGIDLPTPKEEESDRSFYGAIRIQYYHYFKKR